MRPPLALDQFSFKVVNQWLTHQRLTDTKKRNFQIEKEFLVIYFGLMRLREHNYGQSVVDSDHKQLFRLIVKPIASCSPRTQRFRMQLQRFEFFVGILSAVRRRLTFSWMAKPFSEKVCEDKVHMVFYHPSTE